nr:MAG TPA: Non-structural protein NS3/Small envelope protein E [Bacteriophage sp.]
MLQLLICALFLLFSYKNLPLNILLYTHHYICNLLLLSPYKKI